MSIGRLKIILIMVSTWIFMAITLLTYCFKEPFEPLKMYYDSLCLFFFVQLILWFISIIAINLVYTDC